MGILGHNGAGKTTLFNLISGDVLCDNYAWVTFLHESTWPGRHNVANQQEWEKRQ